MRRILLAAGAAALLGGAALAVALGGGEGDGSPARVKPPPPTTTPLTTSTAREPASEDESQRPRPEPQDLDAGDVSARPQPGAAAGLTVGIGDNNPAFFASPLFARLGVDKARLVTAWDTTRVQFERAIVDSWLAEARRTGTEPFVTFSHSRVDPEKLPTVAEFRRAFRAFRRRYPDVRIYAPWNEINHRSQPTHDAPRRAAEYYNVVREECRGCTVLAGDVLDQEGMTRYLGEYRRHLDGTPRIWGLHNYSDTNRFRNRGTRELLAAVPGDVWLTETGGIVRFGADFPYDPRRAARALNYTFRLARQSERIPRIYVYNWTGVQRSARFDSGLVGPDGRARPAYDVVRAAVRGR